MLWKCRNPVVDCQKKNMSDYSSYGVLDVWKKAQILAGEICKLTANFSKDESYELIMQMRRAAVSIASNIEKGCGRQFKNDTLLLPHIGRGSQYELEPETLLAFNLGCISDEEGRRLDRLFFECRKLSSGFINHVESINLK